MAKGCDSSWDFDYKSRVDALVDEGYVFIGRYLNHAEGYRNRLTVSEAERLSEAGIFIVSLYEHGDGDQIEHFTRANGIADAQDAISLAEEIGMPTGNPIYFCIDTDVRKSEMSTNIVPYVQGIISELEDSGYKLGQRVRHAKFGEGTIVNMEGSGEHSRLQVAFQGQGIKWLVAAYARLETV